MKQPVFRGCGTALVTPMYPDGRVNYSALRQLIEYQIQHGADALILCGTTGEAPSLDDKEHLLVFAFAREAIAGRVPFIAGTGSNDTRHAVAMSLEAKQCHSRCCGAAGDCVQCALPHRNEHFAGNLP